MFKPTVKKLCNAIGLILCVPLTGLAQSNETESTESTETGSTEAIEEILVTGQRGGQARALSDQYSANNSRNVVSADQAGQFPDLNIAESLRRIPGVTVQREVVGGEGRYISIRGMDSGLNNIQINGINASQPEKDNRRVPLDMIQTSALSKITVHKTLTPDLESDGIGGAVQLETATAFDFSDRMISFSLKGFNQDLADEFGPIVEGTFASRFGSSDQFGFLISMSYADRSTRGYVFYNDEDQLAFIEDDPASGVTPLQFHLTSYENQRENYLLKRKKIINQMISCLWQPTLPLIMSPEEDLNLYKKV